MMWKKHKDDRIDNFDFFIFNEIYQFLERVQPMMNSTNTNAEVLAIVDSIMIGMRHAMRGEQGESCDCCKYWCAGTRCKVVSESWYLFLEVLPELKFIQQNA